MKMTTGILGCALVAGLMTFASDNVQAGGIGINGVLFSTLNVKATITTETDNKFKKMSFGNKDILALANLDVKGAILTVNYHNAGVYVVIKQGGSYTNVADLTDDGSNNTYVGLSDDFYIGTTKEDKNGYEYSDQGALDFYAYQYTDDAQTNYTEVDLNGTYTDKYKFSENNTSTKQSYSLTAKNMSGSSYSYDGREEDGGYYDYEPATGSISEKGNVTFKD